MLRLEDLYVANYARRQGLVPPARLAPLLAELDGRPEPASLARTLAERAVVPVDAARQLHEASRRRVRQISEEAYAAQARRAAAVAPQVLDGLLRQLAQDGFAWSLGQRLVEAHGLDRGQHEAFAREAARLYAQHEQRLLGANRASGWAPALGADETDSARLARSSSGVFYPPPSPMTASQAARQQAYQDPTASAVRRALTPEEEDAERTLTLDSPGHLQPPPSPPDPDRTVALPAADAGGAEPTPADPGRTLFFDETLGPAGAEEGLDADLTVRFRETLAPPGGGGASGRAPGSASSEDLLDPFRTMQVPQGGAAPDAERTVSLSAADAAGAGGGGPPAIGRYQVVRELGRGNMGVVYLARDPQADGRFVAVKLVQGPASNDEARARFKREIMVSQRVQHEHVIQALDAGDLPDGSSYMVMEFLEGEELRSMLRRGPLPQERALALFEQLLEGLAAVHEQMVVHRDLKPENVLVVQRYGGDHLKIMDFGISRLLDVAESQEQVFVTVRGTLSGTPAYVAPEAVVEPDLVRASHDLYAAGVILFEMLTGRLPFSASRTLRDILADTLEAQAPPLTQAHPENAPFPQAVERLVRRFMEKDPEARPADAAQALVLLQETQEALARGDRPKAPARRRGAGARREGITQRLIRSITGIFKREPEG